MPTHPAGGVVLMEVEDEAPAGVVKTGAKGTAAVAKAQQTFDAAIEQVRDLARVILAKLRELADPPDERAMHFGMKMTLAGSAVIASATAEANFKVSLTWKRAKAG